MERWSSAKDSLFQPSKLRRLAQLQFNLQQVLLCFWSQNSHRQCRPSMMSWYEAWQGVKTSEREQLKKHIAELYVVKPKWTKKKIGKTHRLFHWPRTRYNPNNPGALHAAAQNMRQKSNGQMQQVDARARQCQCVLRRLAHAQERERERDGWHLAAAAKDLNKETRWVGVGWKRERWKQEQTVWESCGDKNGGI